MLVLFEWSYFKRLFNAGGTQYKQVMFGTSSDVDTTAQNWALQWLQGNKLRLWQPTT